ncbi:hypothetical protein LJC48_01110 [Desulfovibrio sp. OttesenSCG-928-C06]|nr:hypothetical protein [Desulfovibrio sp. OttesenSCG-928-C06]
MKDHRSILLGSDIKDIHKLPEGADYDFCYTKPDGFYYQSMKPIGDFRAGNSRRERPEYAPGFHPRWNGEQWEQVENHIGEEGYLNGEPTIIKAFGPLPEGWSAEAPEPTAAEVARQRMAVIDMEIRELEVKTNRPRLAIDLKLDEPYDHERLDELMTQIIDLRCERQLLEVVLEQEKEAVQEKAETE